MRDRVVQGALKHALEPIFERDFSEHSPFGRLRAFGFGFRPGRSAKDALRRVEGQLHEGRIWGSPVLLPPLVPYAAAFSAVWRSRSSSARAGAKPERR